jgi:membrane fusion protein (multidrug efflux system)
MEIEPALPKDVVDPAPESRRVVRALDAKLVQRLPEAAPPAPARPAPKRTGIGRLVFLAIAAIVLGAAGFYAYDWWTTGRFIVSTDDAYVGADAATIAPKITGYIKSVPVSNNEHVKAGDPLVIIDDADYRIALGQSEAQIASAEATVSRIGEQIGAGEAQVKQAEAQVASTKAAAQNAKADFERANTLVAKSFVTNQQVDTARTAMLQADAAAASAEAGLTAAKANVAVVTAQRTEAERSLDQYKLARDQAALNLDHTIIRAPYDGVVGNRAAEPGAFVQPGQRLMAVVPLDDVYVDANFKETQLAGLKPGQPVKVAVDAYPGAPITGTVESISPASGAVFSLLPPENATGNFTKIVQRLAVRIRLSGQAVAEGLIRPGMSVVASVDTRSMPGSVASR